MDEADAFKEEGKFSSKLSQIIIRLYDESLKCSVLLINDNRNYYSAFYDKQKKLKQTKDILLKNVGFIEDYHRIVSLCRML